MKEESPTGVTAIVAFQLITVKCHNVQCALNGVIVVVRRTTG